MSEEKPRRSRRLASRGEDPAPNSNARNPEGGLPVPLHPLGTTTPDPIANRLVLTPSKDPSAFPENPVDVPQVAARP